MVRFLDAVQAVKHRAILTTCYAAGLRISEALRPTVSDIDSRRMVLRVANGKGQKDRYVMLSPKLLAVLRHWWLVERPRHWLFPGARPQRPITRRPVFLACRWAASRAGLNKPISPHSNQRLCSLDNSSVRCRYTDYRQNGASRKKTMTLSATEFIRRMLLHVLPPGLQRIRHYGFLANRVRQQKLAECRRLPNAPPSTALAQDAPDYRDRHEALTYSPNAKGNFQFDRVITGWRDRPVLDLRLKR